ncbi:DUF928 domain-containing protein [Oscillatoria sp. FACHB-1406]|uniref:DUF928 domain-containing protein n=1 Tax=Oscillatoria sp. FACHB-1406 TaxID=2692846 RepID=UPI001687E893|nr:DUF928 domain-containing protein [Oscillatoria sp. FACHB-1406]MBD2579888.1 DUF928 domain-containing protein [Oscillatoria sp. FACHB-1406]
MNPSCIYSTVVLFLAAIAPQGVSLFLNSAIAFPTENTLIVQSPSPSPTPPPPPPPPPRNPKPVGSTKPPRVLNPFAFSCQNSQQILTGLIPADEMSLTTSAHPTLLFYIPESSEAIRDIEFYINNEDGKKVGKVFIAPPKNTPGIISVSLPKIPQNELEVGKTYTWYFNFSCAGTGIRKTRPIEVSGTIQRVSRTPQLERKIADGDPYIWLDAIASVFQQRLENPEDVEAVERWQNLLQYIGEEGLAKQPILGAASIAE